MQAFVEVVRPAVEDDTVDSDPFILVLWILLVVKSLLKVLVVSVWIGCCLVSLDGEGVIGWV